MKNIFLVVTIFVCVKAHSQCTMPATYQWDALRTLTPKVYNFPRFFWVVSTMQGDASTEGQQRYIGYDTLSKRLVWYHRLKDCAHYTDSCSAIQGWHDMLKQNGKE